MRLELVACSTCTRGLNLASVDIQILNSIADNQITEINGISSLHQLTHLSLADNRLERITNLDHLPIKTLNLVSRKN